jgi:hypothetical protein
VANLKAFEESAKERERQQAAAHAEALDSVRDQLKAVKAELALWKSLFMMVSAALVVAVVVVFFLIFKIFSAPLLLAYGYFILFSLVVGLALVYFYFPKVFEAIVKFLWWIWQNPKWGIVVIFIIFILYRFLKNKVKLSFGKLSDHSVFKLKSKLEERLLANILAVSALRLRVKLHEEVIRAKDAKISKLMAGAEEQMFSSSPPISADRALPSHTPIVPFSP